MLERVSFTSRSGGSADGVLALPPAGGAGNSTIDGPHADAVRAGRAPAIVVLHEYWGVNQQIQDIAERFAGEGFVALVPDLYHGVLAKDAAEAGALMGKLDWPKALDEIAGAVAYLREHPRSTGKVAVTGFCMGGALSFATACTVPGLAAVVPYYGLPPSGAWDKVDAPVQAHFAAKDGWATPEGARKIQDAIVAAGGAMELHVYDADHAFCNERRPEVYSAAAATQSWQRTVAFLRANM